MPFPEFFAWVNPVVGSSCGNFPQKYERPVAWERPAFLRSPPGCGVSKPWGVWEGGFDERLGEPPAGYVDLLVSGALGWEALPIWWEKPFRYELTRCDRL